ncbi:MAG: glycosyltransferase family 1 protein [Candidatus Edwardsbacteria bacterium]
MKNKQCSVYLIGASPAEKFYSMEVYGKALARNLRQQSGVEVKVHQWSASKTLKIDDWRGVRAVRTYWNRFIRSPRELNIPVADVYHILDHSYAHLITTLPARRTVITCHDLMPLLLPDYRATLGGWLQVMVFKYTISSLLQATYIISISEFTKRCLRDILKIEDSKISVIPLGVEEIFLKYEKSIRPTFKKSEEKIILQVGVTQEAYKNVFNILKAFRKLVESMGDKVRLLKVGKPYTPEQQVYINSVGLKKQIEYLGYVEREKLPEIYGQADLLLMPSLFEGFGLPILEAMACGTPVVTSRRGSIPEVASEAAFYVEPEKPEGIAEGVKKVLFEQELRAKLIKAGEKQAQKFTWEKTAEKTLKVYKKIE